MCELSIVRHELPDVLRSRRFEFLDTTALQEHGNHSIANICDVLKVADWIGFSSRFRLLGPTMEMSVELRTHRNVGSGFGRQRLPKKIFRRE
jgi:hypothetical protein